MKKSFRLCLTVAKFSKLQIKRYKEIYQRCCITWRVPATLSAGESLSPWLDAEIKSHHEGTSMIRPMGQPNKEFLISLLIETHL